MNTDLKDHMVALVFVGTYSIVSASYYQDFRSEGPACWLLLAFQSKGTIAAFIFLIQTSKAEKPVEPGRKHSLYPLLSTQNLTQPGTRPSGQCELHLELMVPWFDTLPASESHLDFLSYFLIVTDTLPLHRKESASLLNSPARNRPLHWLVRIPGLRVWSLLWS